ASIAAFFKYNGPEYQYVSSIDDQGNTHITKEKQDGFGWMNASVKKSFFDKKFEITLGARNLLDVTSIRTTSGSSAGHGGGDRSFLMGYGRSYFLKLMYNLNF